MSYIMVDVEADRQIPGDYSLVCFGAIGGGAVDFDPSDSVDTASDNLVAKVTSPAVDVSWVKAIEGPED